jgi:SAM-dependent methyltransferase
MTPALKRYAEFVSMAAVSPGVQTHGRARYARYWGTEFWDRVHRSLPSAAQVLDVGGGRRPTILPHERDRQVHYVGLDPVGAEMALAPPGSYDEEVEGRAEECAAALVGRFDLIVSWQVLEHVRDMERAVANFHAYLKPSGKLVCMLSGRNAVYAIPNRMLPKSVARVVVSRLRRRPLDTVFPAYYDRCDERGLRAVFSGWDELEVIPLWRGADYFERLPGLRGAYLRYEDLAVARRWTGLATHYLVAGRKPAGAGSARGATG